jgi:Mor family transcriptional regulator
LNEEQEREVLRLNREESFSLAQLAAKYACSHMTIYRIIKRIEQEAYQDHRLVA